MLNPRALLDAVAESRVFRAVGVPDSTLQPFIGALEGDSRFSTLIATNECEAISIAFGHYLGSRAPSLVYLQNSGFGKTVHPITSLLSREICRAPALLLIGWRGCPDPDVKPDEPQHAKMGRVMPDLLRAIGVPFEVLTDDELQVRRAVQRAMVFMHEEKTPFALIVKPGLFGADAAATERDPGGLPRRKQVLELVTARLPDDTLYVSTTGKTSRELYAIREERGQEHSMDFYTVGGMGCASAIALGLAEAQPRRRVCLLDGDGAALMHLGNFATIGKRRPGNLLHILIDNQAHESTGGQPTASGTADLAAIARASGYPAVGDVRDIAGLEEALRGFRRGPCLIRVRTALGSDPRLGRPTSTPRENVEAFQAGLGV